MQFVLNCILFCSISLLGGFCFTVGLFFGYKRKTSRKPKTEAKPLTEEQERLIERQKRQEKNFWSYDGNPQDTI